MACPNPAALASTTERVVVNRFSGLAIEGFDPVAYFVKKQPVLGLPDYEAAQAGAVWRFHNQGNRASFAAHPEIYGPQFGGYDPIDVAAPLPSSATPLLRGHPPAALPVRARGQSGAFATHPERHLPEARARWPQLAETLTL